MSHTKKEVSLDHLNITVHNFQETANWYKNVFNFEIVEQGMMFGAPWGVLRSGKSMLCIYESPAREAHPAGDDVEFDKFHRIYHFALRIQDRKDWEKTILEQKLKVKYGGPVEYPHSTSWYIYDPSGYQIEVVDWKEGSIRFPL